MKIYFEAQPPTTVNEAAAKIEQLTGVRRGPTQVRRFLGSLGLRPRKGRYDPRQGERARASAFQTKELELRLEEATEGKRIVYFVDAAHLVLAPFFGLFVDAVASVHSSAFGQATF